MKFRIERIMSSLTDTGSGTVFQKYAELSPYTYESAYSMCVKYSEKLKKNYIIKIKKDEKKATWTNTIPASADEIEEALK